MGSTHGEVDGLGAEAVHADHALARATDDGTDEANAGDGNATAPGEARGAQKGGAHGADRGAGGLLRVTSVALGVMVKWRGEGGGKGGERGRRGNGWKVEGAFLAMGVGSRPEGEKWYEYARFELEFESQAG